jgi:hypothetical protein
MPSPPLRKDIQDQTPPQPHQLPSAQYNLNAERTDQAYDDAKAALVNAAAAQAAATAASAAASSAQTAAGAKYTKPPTGIPEADLAAGVVAKLNDSGSGGPVAADDITDATPIGVALVTAANQTAGRAAIAAASTTAVDAAQTAAEAAHGAATAAGTAAAGAQQDAESAQSTASAAGAAAAAAQSTATAAGAAAAAAQSTANTALAALPGKADDAEITALDGRLTSLEAAPPGSGPTAYRVNIGNGSPGPYLMTHGKNTKDFVAAVFKNPGHVDNLGDGSQVLVPIIPMDNNTALVDTTETWNTDVRRFILWPMPGGDVTAPAAPTLNEVSKTQTTISVSATGTTASSYEWLRGGAIVARTSANTYNHTSLSPNVPYTCAVRAYDLMGNMVQSADVVITTTASGDVTAPTAPNTPVLVSKTQTTVTMTLGGGTDAVGVTGYHVYRGGVKITGTAVAAGNYQDTGRTQNTAYVYASTAVDAAGNESALSGNLNVTTDAAPPANITTDATSAISRSTTAGATISTDVTIDIADAADYLSVRASVSIGSGATDWAALDTLTATVISINGGAVSIPLTRRGSSNVGTQNLGSVHIFDLVNPAAGTFVIRVTVAEAGSSFVDLRAIARSYIGVGTIGTPVATSSFSGAMSNVVTGPPATGDVVMFIGGWSTSTGGDSFAGGTSLYSAYFNVTGTADYVKAADAAGAGSNITFTANSGPQSGSVAVRLQKAA